ncbi:uncharacterized protein [Choristoneura fumiferana]|uniref:uncharacterized protein n=1 Tax=Choristoneura fumiferana TaxID=7141 RepID=UPI003D15625B
MNINQLTIMQCEIMLLLCTTFGLVKNFPIQVLEYVDPATGDLEVFEIVNEPDYVDFEHKQVKKSILNPCVQSQNGEVMCFFQDQERRSQFEENLKLSNLPHAEENFGTIDQSQWNNQRPDYDQNMQNSGMTFEEYPFFNPSPISFNPSYPSPVSNYNTRIHGLAPSEDSAQIFNSNIYQSQDMLPLNLRLARRTSNYDEFLAQLAHDAMINNILPTMPYVRTSEGYQVPYGSRQAIALYPRAGIQSCAQPILLGCSPSIFQGSLVPRSHSTGHQYFVDQAPLQYDSGHVTNYKHGYDKVKPTAILPNQDYRKLTTLVSDRKI